MAEVLVQFDGTISDTAGRVYRARVCGRQREDGLWEGWIEFVPADGSPVLRTPRETDQPNRTDLEYWATGLTAAYLEGALERAQRPLTQDSRPPELDARPAYPGPAPSTRAAAPADISPLPPVPESHAVLDPFEVYSQGEHVLREQLSALDDGHLRNIIRAYGFADERGVRLEALGSLALAEIIVTGVRRGR